MKRVLLLLCKGFELYEAAAYHDVFGWSRAYGTEAVEVVTAGMHGEVQGTFGVRVLVDKLLEEVDASEFDALAIPGGFETWGFQEEGYCGHVTELIRAFDRPNKPISSICAGALAVRANGVLEGRRATTYHLMGGARRTQLADFGVSVVDGALVRDGNVVTSTAPATAMDVAFDLLATLTGSRNAAEVRRLMGFSGPFPRHD